jgi:hypothetical protein
LVFRHLVSVNKTPPRRQNGQNSQLVKFRLIHENLLPEDIEKDPNTFQGINNGWPAVLSSLKNLLETGEPKSFSVSY